MNNRPHWSMSALCAALLGVALLVPAGSAKAQDSVGVLRCDVAGGIGFVFGSSRSLDCVYSGNDGSSQSYSGEIRKFGIDIGFTKSGVILWGVVAPGVNVSPGSLAGTYAGVSAQAAAVRGVGANALISTSKIMLNPLSVEGVKGVNIAAGVTGLRLEPASGSARRGRDRYQPPAREYYQPDGDDYPVVPPPG